MKTITAKHLLSVIDAGGTCAQACLHCHSQEFNIFIHHRPLQLTIACAKCEVVAEALTEPLIVVPSRE